MANNTRPISPYAQTYLNNITGTTTTYYMEFTKAFHSNKYQYFAFIEGNDKPYYIIPCEHILGKDSTYFIRCNGKKNVKELVYTLENTTESSYRTSNFFGFIDKDYGLDDDFSFNNKQLQNHHLYITPHYSFENFYLNKNTFSKILETEFQITEFGLFSIDYHNTIKNFEDRLSEYIQIIVDIDKKYRAYQICKKVLKANHISEYHSNNIDIENFVNINLKQVCLKSGRSTDDCFKIVNNIKIHDCFTNEGLSHSEQCYPNYNIWEYCKIIRGKFLILFLVKYLKQLKDDLNGNNPICFCDRKTKKDSNIAKKEDLYKCRLNVDIETICSVLAQYAEQPQCLIDFLNDRKRIK